MTRARRAVGVVLLIVALAGCATTAGEPRLPFPRPPAMEFWLVAGGKAVCLSPEDAQRFAAWLEQVDEFLKARERLTR